MLPFTLDPLPQALGLDGHHEEDLDLGGGLLGGGNGGDPVAGDHVLHGEGDAAGGGAVGAVVDPDVVRLVGGRHPVEVGAPVGKLAMRAVHLTPLLVQSDDLGHLLLEQAWTAPAGRRSCSVSLAWRSSHR
jgi:hypothetical protein